jgi:predicted short-subunit dehydrogenase-like oxidoreductase (DUF2520 family)
MHGRDDGRIAMRQRQDAAMEKAGHPFEIVRKLALGLSGERFQIAARAEHLARAVNQHGAHVGILAASTRGVAELACEIQVDSICRVGPVERHASYVISDLEKQVCILRHLRFS